MPENSDEFLALFPHRYDYIWAVRPSPGEKPQWQTETRYPLSDRLINEGLHLYGVRFGPQTHYLLLDIDVGSPYHPRSDRLAIPRLLAALEPLGLVSYLPCSSSYSGGLHLYFPFETPQKTWDLAFVVQSLLERSGFTIRQGQLELFPNPKLYVRDGTPGLYAAHRLPLQEPGSYLLDAEWTPYSTSRQQFVQVWQWATARNTVQAETVVDLVQAARYLQRGLSRAASKFLNDLNTEIEQGWTSFGQTNRLLGRIAMRSYIFGHLLYGSEPLEGKALIHDIVQTARSLPGYGDWCRHQHEIEKRAEDWARCVESSEYFPYRQGEKTKRSPRTRPALPEQPQNWNQQQSEDARTRIRQAIAHLLNGNHFPSQTTARFKALVQMGIGGSTLYRHRDLWHPHYIQSPSEILGEPINIEGGAQSKEDYAPLPKSLLQSSGRNLLSGHDPADSTNSHLSSGRNSLTSDCAKSVLRDRYRQRMEAYLASNDPILVAEAQRWFAQQDGLPQAIPTSTPQPATPIATENPVKTSEPVEGNPSDTFQCPDQPLNGCITSREDFQVLVEAIAYHLTRLKWSAQDISQQLMQCFGKPLQALLSDSELSVWLRYLEEL